MDLINALNKKRGFRFASFSKTQSSKMAAHPCAAATSIGSKAKELFASGRI